MELKNINEYINKMQRTGSGKNTKSVGFSGATDLSEEGNGSISGYFATFHHDRADSYGEVIRRGSFLDSIRKRKEQGYPFPLCVQHNFEKVIGYVTDIGENDYGAYFTANFFPTELAQEYRMIVKAGCVFQFSFAFNILEKGKVQLADGSTATELRKLDLIEISLVVSPANDRAVLIDVKRERERALKYIEKMDLEKDPLFRCFREYEEKEGGKPGKDLHDVFFYEGLIMEARSDAATDPSYKVGEKKARRKKTVSLIQEKIREIKKRM